MVPAKAAPFLDHLEEKRAVLEANADSEELAADLLDARRDAPSAWRDETAHRGSPDYASLLLAQLDSATKEEVLPCSVQEGVKLNSLKPHATWSASSCLARCARHDKCVAFGFAPPPKDGDGTDSDASHPRSAGFVTGTCRRRVTK